MNIFEVETTDQYIRDKYKKLFNGVGLLKGYKLKLNVNTSGKPVAQPVRRNPFGVREKVEKKLDKLLACGIIEEVPERPTSWVSPLVVITKPGDVRICVDIRRTNQAIIRERQPIPTVKEVLLQDLNGSTVVFNRVDLKWEFPQILLAEESKHVTKKNLWLTAVFTDIPVSCLG